MAEKRLVFMAGAEGPTDAPPPEPRPRTDTPSSLVNNSAENMVRDLNQPRAYTAAYWKDTDVFIQGTQPSSGLVREIMKSVTGANQDGTPLKERVNRIPLGVNNINIPTPNGGNIQLEVSVSMKKGVRTVIIHQLSSTVTRTGDIERQQ